MRKLIVCNIISLDGYYEGPGNDVMAMPFGDSFSDYNAERLRKADTLLLGRTTAQGFYHYWPPVADDPTQPKTEQEISHLNATIQKVIISDTLTDDDTAPWQNTSRVVKRADARTEVVKLKQQEGKEILVFGSHIMWNDLLAAGLVDELHLMIGPALLGKGTPLFEKDLAVKLQLIESRTMDDSQLVLALYRSPTSL